MIDPILSARLETLKDNLGRVKDIELPKADTKCWLALKSEQFPPGTATFVRERLAQAMRDQAAKHLKAISKIERGLSNAEAKATTEQHEDILRAWYDYLETQEECREVFGDCLAFLGGLIFRSMSVKGIEDRIYELADALVLECAAAATTGVDQWSPTVPFLPETLIRTAARITGLRVQEWTIWTLPFSVRELGCVLFCEIEHMREFVDQRTACVTDHRERRNLAKELYESLADAFATYHLGPAYPCALLILGLNPVSFSAETMSNPSPAKRAQIVLSLLERMDNASGEIGKPYIDVRRKLVQQWDFLLDRLGPDVAHLSPGEKAEADLLVADIWTYFIETFSKSTAKYSSDRPASECGWKTAIEWGETWKAELDNEDLPLSINPDGVGRQNRLADVLNAAWWCRLQYPNDSDVANIAEAAYDLAREVMRKAKSGSLDESKK